MTLQSEDMGKLVALSDLSQYPGGPTVLWSGEEVFVARTFGVADCLVEVRHLDGRNGTWARSCFRPAHREAQPETDGGGEIDAIVKRITGHARATGAAWLEADVYDLVRAFLRDTPEGQTEEADREVIATAVFDCPEIRGEFDMATARKVADYILAALASKGV